MTEKWIQKALSEKGSKGKLHRKLGIALDEKIPTASLKAAQKKGGKLGKEAQLAQTLKKISKKK